MVVQGVLNHLSHTHAHDCESASTQGKVLRLNDSVPQKLIQVHSLWHDGPLNLDEHRGEEAGNHEVQRIVGHDLSASLASNGLQDSVFWQRQCGRPSARRRAPGWLASSPPLCARQASWKCTRTPEIEKLGQNNCRIILRPTLQTRSEAAAYPEITKKPPTSTFSCVSNFSIVRFFVPNLQRVSMVNSVASAGLHWPCGLKPCLAK